MSETKKHATPLWCRVRRLLTSPSPSAVAWCYLGLRPTSRRCEGCQNNAGEQMHEAFQKGMEAGRELLKNHGIAKTLQICAADLSFLEQTSGEEEQNDEPPT